jgi:hypothetical protein
MTRVRNRTLLFVLGIASCAGYAQTKPATIQQQSERSICANVVALAGNVDMKCSNLTPAQIKAIAEIPAILKTALTNQAYLEAIKAKMDEMTQSGTTVIVHSGGVASVGQTGGITAGVVNVNEPTIPKFLGVEQVTKYGRGYTYPDKDSEGHPITYAKFYSDSIWDKSIFVVGCDRPCAPHDADILNANITLGGSVTTFSFGGTRSVVGFELTGLLHPMMANRYYLVSVVSQDTTPVKIVDIAPFLQALPPH